MKILLSGYHNPNFTNSTVWREKAIEALGHTLVSFEDRKFLIPGRIRDNVRGLQQWDLARINRELKGLCSKARPDLCIVNGGHRILPETVAGIKKMGIPICLWTTDAPVDFNNILDAAPFYDHLFCGGSEALEIFNREGLQNVSWLPFACDPQAHQPMRLSVQERVEYGRDLVFVGSFYPNRAEILEKLSDFNLGVWGPYWGKLPAGSWIASKSVDIKMNYDQWTRIYSACKICLVIHFNDGKVPCHQISPKLFEAMACGAFVLTDRQKDVQQLFKDQEHLVFFDGPDDLKGKAKYYLEHEEVRRRIADEGRKEVIARHRYQDRILEILNVMRSYAAKI